MIVQTYFPQKLSPSQYDSFLASGWFRGSVMLYKMDLLCIEDDVFSVVNIRLNLKRFEYSKSQRKIKRNVENKFRVTMGLASPNDAKEALYVQQKSKFKGFIHATLHDYLNSGFHNTVFDTRELCVYDGNKLIAVSYFDIGEKSMASLLGLYDGDYEQYSLGVYTMLREIEYGMAHLKWYYPGYILDKPSSFNYKLRLGPVEYYNSNKRWSRYEQFNPEETIAFRLKRCLDLLRIELKAEDLPFEEKMYPFFSMGYMGYWNTEFIKFPYFMVLQQQGDRTLLASFNLESNAYELIQAELTPSYDHLINMEMSAEFGNSKRYHLELLHTHAHVLTEHEVSVFVNECKLFLKR